MTSIIVRMICRNAAEDQPTASTLMQGMSSAAKVFLVAATKSSTLMPRQVSSITAAAMPSQCASSAE
jgi:hypothetical protein